MHSCILITGATGFLGKVVLEEVLRRRDELHLKRVYVLVRKKKGRDPQSRFDKEIGASPCFEKLPRNWSSIVEAIEGDVTQDRCGIVDEKKYLKVCLELTHIINCAADVSFETPIKEAVTANVTTSVCVHRLAQECPNLRRIAITSTAYVAHNPGPLYEELAPLPCSAEEILEAIDKEKSSEKTILKFTGHPNTYTLTKCLSEHVIFNLPSRVPVTMVRPSIISVSREYPYPGWVDSWAAFAGITGAVGTGLLKALIADPKAFMDVVPVDNVARCLIDETFRDVKPQEKGAQQVPRIAYAVASLHHALQIGPTCNNMVHYFQNELQYDQGSGAVVKYMGPKNLQYRILDCFYYRLPIFAAQTLCWVCCDTKKKQEFDRTAKTKVSLEIVLSQFATKTWDFRAQEDLLPGFDSQEYARLVCVGVEKHLLKKLKL